MTQAIAAYGTLLKMGDGGGPEVFTTVAEVTDISGPGLSLDTVDVTSHDSTDAWREFIATLKDAGEVTFDINYVPTNATHGATTGLLKALDMRTKKNWRLVFPDTGATTWNFSGFVTGFEPGEPVDDALTASVTIKLTGEPTLV